MKTYLMTAVVSLLLAVAVGKPVVMLLRRLKFGQNILGYVKEHDYKRGTATMGGIIFMAACTAAFFAFSKGKRTMATACLSVGLGYMIVGGIDDFIKIKLKRNEGLSALQKTLFELAIALIVAVYAQTRGLTRVYIPFYNGIIDLKLWHFPLCVFAFLATTNCVNLTDGLDGLAAGTSYVYCAALAAVISVQTANNSSLYLSVAEYRNVIVLLCALVGGLIGFLCFNTFKATVFMGDTGSLALGGLIASASLVSGNLFFIPIIGIMFVLSGISVIMQVAHFKRTGKRIFLMSPLHHHFQHKGYSESKIGFTYKAVTFIFGAFSVISLL